MKLNEVKSSTVAKIGYDYDKHSLYVTFVGGGEYVYENVPVDVYAKLLEADSKGKFLHREVLGKYNYLKIK